jgi:hypothetical protein
MCRRASRLDASVGARAEPGYMRHSNVADAISSGTKLFTVSVHPLLAQDFFTVSSRDRLFVSDQG